MLTRRSLISIVNFELNSSVLGEKYKTNPTVSINWLFHGYIIIENLRKLNECTWTLHSLVMIWIDANVFLLRVKRIKAAFERLQFMMTLKIWPSPNPTVNYVW